MCVLLIMGATRVMRWVSVCVQHGVLEDWGLDDVHGGSKAGSGRPGIRASRLQIFACWVLGYRVWGHERGSSGQVPACGAKCLAHISTDAHAPCRNMHLRQ